ncbi:transaldolase [Neomicrococcus aestuarii]|uniref:Transaldolase n=1 Tax=Neomicrococcus aestuarii TaxID=556325 RepID=A0A1L2ZLB9_9MICC|nr:transaldolase [Neomicrococcus aestuarii]APF40183.1 transaldolase [Neomicrococcus aestuarii]MBB5511824.1 transaldolase [Neomicrococcus aestuarii]
MSNKNTQALSAAGVSIWIDDLSRGQLNDGSLQKLVDEFNVTGVTTNPTIFANALKNGDDYAEQVAELAASDLTLDESVMEITTRDVANACDLFAGLYQSTKGVDGRVSIEVDPRLARKTAETIEEAKKLFEKVSKENVLIKIPATQEGLEAITAVTAAGISVNVTLIFDLERYRAVINAYLLGLEQAREAGHDLSKIHSVASFFVSRVDSEIDKRLNELGTDEALALRGKAGVANARLAFQVFEQALETERWKTLAAQGANPQRPLWASTGVKDPSYSDTLYVDSLVTAGTVNTMPHKTLMAVADHGGDGADGIAGTYEASNEILDSLARVGIDYDDVVELLEAEGLEKFDASWEELLDGLQQSLDAARKS